MAELLCHRLERIDKSDAIALGKSPFPLDGVRLV